MLEYIADTGKYMVCTSVVGNHVRALWENREHTRKIHLYSEAFDAIPEIPGSREFSSSRTFHITKGGLGR